MPDVSQGACHTWRPREKIEHQNTQKGFKFLCCEDESLKGLPDKIGQWMSREKPAFYIDKQEV